MMCLLRTVRAEVHRATASRRFATALILPFLFYLGSGIEEISALWNSTHTDVIHFAAFLGDVGSFSTMLILAACLPFACAYCDDVRHQYIRCLLPRCGERNYCIAKMSTGAITGGVVAATGFLLFVLFLSIRFPLAIEGSGMYDSFVMARESNYWGELLYSGRPLAFLGMMAYCCGLFGALWGAVGVAVSGLLPNPFVAMFLPFLLNIISYLLPIPALLKPESILQGRFNLGGWLTSAAFSTGYITLLIFAFYFVFRISVRRRLRHG